MKLEINSDDFEQKKLEQDALHKELDLIQSCITRMAHNAFLYKGWFITLAAGTAALSVSNDRPLWVTGIGLVLLTAIIWLLDTFFLWTEQKYRKLYGWVLAQRAVGIFEKRYDLNPTRFNTECSKWVAFKSWPSVFLYFPVGLLGLSFIVAKIVEECSNV